MLPTVTISVAHLCTTLSLLLLIVSFFLSFLLSHRSPDEKADDVLLNRSFLRIIEVLSPDSSERAVLEACERLNELGKTHPEQVRSLMTAHGVVPIMEMLEVGNVRTLLAILKVVNNVVGKNHKFQQNMSLVGLIPAIIRFGGQAYPREIRMEAANFVRQFCYASDWTRKMFIACDGLPVLVSFLMEEYNQSKTLVWNAIGPCAFDASLGWGHVWVWVECSNRSCAWAHAHQLSLLRQLFPSPYPISLFPQTAFATCSISRCGHTDMHSARSHSTQRQRAKARC